MIPAEFPRLEQLAQQFQITITPTWGGHSNELLNGPGRYAGLDLETRTVFYGEDLPGLAFRYVFHEIMHIVTAPPGIPYDSISEDFLLLQLERAFVRDLPRDIAADILEWQLETEAPLIVRGAGLGEIAQYQLTPGWHQGFRRARHLGLLDTKNRPTGKLPTWTPALLEEAREAARAIVGAEWTVP
jgi:hypothetical protein